MLTDKNSMKVNLVDIAIVQKNILRDKHNEDSQYQSFRNTSQEVVGGGKGSVGLSYNISNR